MTGQERIRLLIDRKPADRVGIFESFWWETERDFHAQGVPAGISMEDYFDLDMGMFWFSQSFLLPTQVLEKTPEYQVVTDEWGTLTREYTEHQATPGLLKFLIKGRDDWEEHKRRLVYHPSRVDWPALEARYRHLRAHGRYVVLSVLDPFECTWHKIGPEAQLMNLITDPAFLMEMYEADVQLVEDAWEDLWSRGLRPDGLWIFGDIAYNHGLFFSPKVYRDVLMPFHRRLCDLAHRHHCQVIYHSDGNVSHAIPLLIEAGIDALHPMEVKAGMDVRELKAAYGDRLAFIGNIDARLFQENDIPGLKAEIRTKVPPAMKGGGYIFHSDHSLPPGTRLTTYQFALELVRDIGRYAN
ncbi:MAG: uroporphyrinogen decarboxylase family protein [Anaerolineae bacterium]